MKHFRPFFLALGIALLTACNTSNAPTLDEPESYKSQTRGDSIQNDSADGGEVNADIKDWIKGGIENIIADEMPSDEGKNDSIPNDTIPNDSTKNKKAFMSIKIK